MGISLNTIIDVGANIGQFVGAVRQFYPNALIHSFEPLPECFEVLVLNTLDKKNIYTYNVALSDFNGELKFNKNNLTYASSALEITEYQKNNLPKTSLFSSISVPCSKLDDLNLDIIPLFY